MKRSVRQFAIAVSLLSITLSSCEMNMSSTPGDPSGGEQYQGYGENPFVFTDSISTSTFSVDVDQASYTNIRRMIDEGRKPFADAVRIEEMLNYFTYRYPEPEGDASVALSTVLGPCPWNPEHHLVHIGIKAKTIDYASLPASNLVFLLDCSGSMAEELPMIREAFKDLTEQMREQDRIAIVTYAATVELVLPSTSGADKKTIINAIDRLSAGGGTNGGEAIQMAYREAEAHFVEAGNNRVILATDGDFNIGISDDSSLIGFVERERDKQIYLTTLGVGTGNYQEVKLEQMADKGNGNYFYLDSPTEAHRTLVGQLNGTLFLVAQDVKVQVDFSPSVVRSYRLIGYENRVLSNSDFADDKKDAGDIGVGQTVTAIYEIEPRATATLSAPMLTFSMRYKEPGSHTSALLTNTLAYYKLPSADEDNRFASAVAEFGLLLRDSKYKGSASITSLLTRAEQSRSYDPGNLREGFVKMVRKYQALP